MIIKLTGIEQFETVLYNWQFLYLQDKNFYNYQNLNFTRSEDFNVTTLQASS